MALNYLLSPEFQISVTSGKPNTGGWIETFLAGTKTKYFTSCGFNGTKNPFRVPLDSLGQALILAEVGSLYDVFVYNRYGTLLFSRYNVSPQDGGAISTANITSEDGSITVTQTEHGVDLSVNGHEASVLRATATTLTSDGRFTFTRRQKTGDAVDVGQQGDILAKQGWFHYDVTVKYHWDSVLSNQSVPVTLSTNVGSSVGVIDLSYAHDVTDTLSGEWRSNADNTEFHVDVSGIPQGMTAEVVDFGIHAINGGGSGSGGSGGATYTGVDGIVVDNDNDEIKPDFDVIQHKLTEGSNIDITDNVISAEVPTQVSELQNDVGYITSADLPTIPVTDVTVDGSSVVVNGVAEITMPDLSGYATDAELSAGLATKQDTISDLSDIRAGAAKGDTAVQPGDLATVATTGSYNDLTNKPDLSIYAQSADLATVATTGDYDDLVNKPSIPAPQVNSDWNSNSGVSQILNKPSLAAVATTGDYDDLLNKPSIPAAQVNADWNSSSGVSEILNKPQNLVQDANYVHSDNNFTNADVNKLNGIAAGAEVNVQSNWSETDPTADSYIQNKPAFAAVAMTGSYADLVNTPTIPSVDQQYSASSTNAQSGTAVAEALATISVDEVPPVTSSDDGKVLTADYTGSVGSYSWEAPQNQVPASTPADYGKVLTVNDVGGLSWETYGESGSLNPGDYDAPAETLRLRFGDHSYDPTSQSYASKFDSITRVSDGIYDFSFANADSLALVAVFSGAFTDFTNNPVDILGMYSTSAYSTTARSFRAMFAGCTGLRSIWNMKPLIGSFFVDSGYCFYEMFSGCSNLVEVHSREGQLATINMESGCRADYMFSGCTSLRICDLEFIGHEGYGRPIPISSMEYTFSNCTSLTFPPMITGHFSSFQSCFYGCSSLKSFSDNPRYIDASPVVGSPSSSGVNLYGMFGGCSSLTDMRLFNLASFGAATSIYGLFGSCSKLEYAPPISIGSNCDATACFYNCVLLPETPNWDYSTITSAERMFDKCVSLRTIGSNVAGLATSATNVDSLFRRCISVETGVLDCYNALAASSTIQSHTDTFEDTGMYSGNDQRSSIPTSWGGTAT